MLTHEDRNEIFKAIGGTFDQHDGAVLEALSQVADQIIAQRLAYAALLAKLDAAGQLDGAQFVASLQAIAPQISAGRGKALQDIASYCQARLGPPRAEQSAAQTSSAAKPASASVPPPSPEEDARLAALLQTAQRKRPEPLDKASNSQWDRGRSHRAQLHLRD